ncbi:Ricin-type beta-trefoil [Mactra antiquata]
MKKFSVWNAVLWISVLYFVTIILLIFLHERENNVFDNHVENNLDILGDDIILIHNGYELKESNKTSIRKKFDIEEQYRKYGPGENGSAVILPGVNISFPGLAERNKKHDFNTFISDMISLHRKMTDYRPTDCKHIKYPDDLPKITIVTIFRDEWWSILLRTVYSVLELSPAHLLHEIIIVDDGSTNVELITTVKIHVNNLEKVRFVQNKVSRGLMMARQAGIDAVQTDLFVVMDGHMEVGPGWLEPLIYRLVQQPKALLCSHVGGIDQKTFEIRINNNKPDEKHYDEQFPFFDHMTLDQMFAPYSEEFKKQRNHSVEPIPYGTIQGMMMVMRKDFFQQLGGFDPGMKVWGSEQIELSVKVWMCGGVVEMVPCSTVAHMYRVTPWGSYEEGNDYHSLNKIRMSQVWMDPPFRDTLDNFLSDKNISVTDIGTRKAIRTRNKCKPYKYFIDKVRSFSDVFIPNAIKASGSIQNHLYKHCVDIATEKEQERLILYPCHKRMGANQYFVLTDKNQIRSYKGNMFDVVKLENGNYDFVLRHTILEWTGVESEWRLNGSRIENIATGLCLTALSQDLLGIKPCIGPNEDKSQMWNFDIKKLF